MGSWLTADGKISLDYPPPPETFPKVRQGPAQAYVALREHPNFEFPEPIANPTPAQAAAYALEVAARFVSPPKVDGEHEEFSCIDIATAIRTRLAPEVTAALSSERDRLREIADEALSMLAIACTMISPDEQDWHTTVGEFLEAAKAHGLR